MKLSRVFCLMVLLICYGVSATGGPVQPAGQQVVSTPFQALTSPSLLSAVEEKSDVIAAWE
jgi:hypothetical protein